MPIIAELYGELHRLYDLVMQQADEFRERVARSEMTPEDERLLAEQYRSRFGTGPFFFTPSALRESTVTGWQPQQETMDIGSAIVAGAIHMAGGAVPAGSCAYGMSLICSQTLSLHLSQTFQMTLRNPLSSEKYDELYAVARKLRFKDESLGLEFEVALVSRSDLPELVEMGSPGIMVHGHAFVVEDFFVDLDESTRLAFLTLVGVHEYGESIFGDHHQATLLEFAVAKHMGILDEYLKFLKARALVKFRDVVVYRLKDMMEGQLKEEHINVSSEAFEADLPPPEDASMRAARALADGFRMPPELRQLYKGVDQEDLALIGKKVAKWIKYITIFEQMDAFFNRALSDVGTALVDAVKEEKADAKSIAVAVRVAMFASLGVVSQEMDDGLLEMKNLGHDVKKELFKKFMAELKATVAEAVAGKPYEKEVMSDPIFGMEIDGILKLAKADSEIWRELGFELKLTEGRGEEEDGSRDPSDDFTATLEQGTIEGLRRLAWEEALSAGAGVDSQRRAMKSFVEEVKARSEIISFLQLNIRQLLFQPWPGEVKRYNRESFLDEQDFAVYLAANIVNQAKYLFWQHHVKAEDVDRVLDLLDAQIEGVMPAVWEMAGRIVGFGSVPFRNVKGYIMATVRALMHDGNFSHEKEIEGLNAQLMNLSLRYDSPSADAYQRARIEKAIEIFAKAYSSNPVFLEQLTGESPLLAREVAHETAAWPFEPDDIDQIVLKWIQKGGGWPRLGYMLREAVVRFSESMILSVAASYPERARLLGQLINFETARIRRFASTSISRLLGVSSMTAEENIPDFGIDAARLIEMQGRKGASVANTEVLPESAETVARTIYNAQEISFIVRFSSSHILARVPGDVATRLEAAGLNGAADPVGSRREAVRILKTVLDYYAGQRGQMIEMDPDIEEGLARIEELFEWNKDALEGGPAENGVNEQSRLLYEFDYGEEPATPRGNGGGNVPGPMAARYYDPARVPPSMAEASSDGTVAMNRQPSVWDVMGFGANAPFYRSTPSTVAGIVEDTGETSGGAFEGSAGQLAGAGGTGASHQRVARQQVAGARIMVQTRLHASLPVVTPAMAPIRTTLGRL